ncbi:unnamed protein product [Effrenium voratum]|nr:unnamed protein product [Effrenium voratum]
MATAATTLIVTSAQTTPCVRLGIGRPPQSGLAASTKKSGANTSKRWAPRSCGGACRSGGCCAANGSRIRERGVRKADIQPETAESIQFSANTTLDHGVNEVWLLHGTSEEAAKAISRSSFLPSSEGCFGTGVYFADDAKKSNQYAKGRTEDNCKIMLLCRVILGNVMVLPKGQDRTADRFAEDPHVDAILGTTDTREFVVYDTAQIYPEYILLLAGRGERALCGDASFAMYLYMYLHVSCSCFCGRNLSR